MAFLHADDRHRQCTKLHFSRVSGLRKKSPCLRFFIFAYVVFSTFSAVSILASVLGLAPGAFGGTFSFSSCFVPLSSLIEKMSE